MLSRQSKSLLRSIILRLAIAAIPLAPTGATATDADSYTAISQTTLDAYVGKTGVFGATAGVQFADGSRWFGASGVTGPAAFENGGRPLTVADRFHIGSQTKTYTGTVILKYVDAGVLDLDQTIDTWLPELTVMSKAMRQQITIRDLITQRSGIAEYLNAPDPNTSSQTVLASWNAAHGQYDLTPSQLVGAALTLKQTMTPGDPSTFAYSNTNFLLLGMIAEKASCATAAGCLPFKEIVQEEVLTPLGLAQTTYPAGTTYDGAHTDATWNEYGVLTDFTNPSPSVPNTAGAMISTVGNQLDWLVELTTNGQHTLSDATFAQRLQMTTDLNGYVGDSLAGYGMAIYGGNSTTTGQPSLGHGGEISGVQTLMFRFPDSNLFIVGDVNTFLSVPADRTLPASTVEDLYYGLERSIMTMTAAQVNGGSCVGGLDPTCTGATVTAVGLTVTGAVEIKASGSFWSNSQLQFAKPVPTLTAYGADITALTVTDGDIRVQESAIVEAIGNNSTALLLNGAANSVQISGQVNATGLQATAIDGSSPATDTVLIQPAGAVTGAIKLTAGADTIIANGMVDGDILLGAAATLSGSGAINGMVSGGTVAPGNSVGTLTVNNYTGNGATLLMEIDGPSATSDKLLVTEQVASGFPVVDTGIATLGGGTLALGGSRPPVNSRLLLLETDKGISGTFATITDNDGLLVENGRLAGHIVTGANSVVAAWNSPAPFDAAADMTYLATLERADQTLARIGGTRPARLKEQGITPFVTLLGSQATVDNSEGVSGYTIHGAGVMGGMDIPINRDAFFGFALSSATGRADQDQGGGEQESLLNCLGLHGGMAAGAYTFGAAVSVGVGDTDYRNRVMVDGIADTATGNSDQRPVTLGLSVNKGIRQGAWRVDIAGNLLYMRDRDTGFSEKGVAEKAAFSYEERVYERLRAGAMATLSRQEPLEQFQPWLALGLYHHFDLNPADLDYRLDHGPAATLEGRDADGLEGRCALGFRRELAGNSEMEFSIDGGLRADVAQTRVLLRVNIPLGDR